VKDIYEKLGLFYLGKDSDDDALTLYKSKHLTTHAAIIGMTGSGKTGLGIGLIEEAAIDNIPAIIIDPKGDMGNLCLAFPKMQKDDYMPWIDESEANAKGKTKEEMAQSTAATWKSGIESFGQDLERVKSFGDVEKTIYTPGSSAGVGVNILGSFDVPSEAILEESDTFAALINTTVSSLLALVSLKSDSLNSKEHLLISNIFNHFWTQNISLSIEELIGYIVSPPFEKIGMLSLGSIYPQKERLKLAQLFNGVISSVTFSTWIKGEPLNIQNMMYDENGKAKIAIFSIAHLNDDERMFFVTMLLNAYISWMRRQRGSTTLKALLYMDEIFGFFPPSKNPPSKEPMLLLLKQARAFGTGVILSTQNPVDIDYKGLSNIGTWFIGKLQTKQDIEKVLDGISAKSELSKKEVAKKIATLKGRHFFLKNVHTEHTDEFYTRWVLSYLKGPMTKDDIKDLMQDKKELLKAKKPETQAKKSAKTTTHKQILSQEIKEYFLDSDINSDSEFYPYLYGEVKLRFYNQKRGIDTEEELFFKLDIDESVNDIEFQEARNEALSNKSSKAKQNAEFAELSPLLKNAKNLKKFEKKLSNYIYGSSRLELFTSKELKMESTLGESEQEFRIDMQNRLKELREEKIEKLQKKFDTKYKSYESKFTKLQIKLEKEEEDVSSKITDTVISVGMTFLGAFFGKKKLSASTLRKGAASLKKGKAVFKERGDVKNTQLLIDELQSTVEELEEALKLDIEEITESLNVDNYEISTLSIKPRRADITIEDFALLWER
jgi:hypothetical protein